MTDKTLENKAVEILDASQEAIGAFADKMVELGKQYGPDVADAALQMARVDAIQSLVPGVIAAVVVVALVTTYGRKFATWFAAKAIDEDEPDPIVIVGCMFVVGPVGMLGFFALERIMNVWAWVGIFEPKLWLAKRILGL